MAAATSSSRPSGPPSLAARSALVNSTGSQTQTQSLSLRSSTRQPVLRLRGATERTGERTVRRIQWAEDVIDNEGLGRKSSKVCCIYHAPKPIDESSDESSSGDSSSDDDDGGARPLGGRRGVGRSNSHGRGHGDAHDCSHNHGNGNAKSNAKKRTRSPNAYEKMPKVKEGGVVNMAE